MNQVSQTASTFIIAVVLLSFIAYVLLLLVTSRMKTGIKAGEEMGHEWDGIKELNSPLPKWWFWTFLGSIIFCTFLIFYYPALGNFAGFGKWTQEKQYQEEVQATNKKYDEYYTSITQGSIEEIAKNPQALKTGRRLFLNNCSVCHGSDAAGAQGFPNLTNSDWLYGGDTKTIEQSIANGRNGLMPPQADAIIALAKANNLNTDTIIDDTASYVMSLSGLAKPNPAGEKIFQLVCSACHTPAGTGMAALGAPNLTDDIWLYDSGEHTKESIRDSIIVGLHNGRAGVMPAQKEILSEDKIKTLAAYVYSLSNK